MSLNDAYPRQRYRALRRLLIPSPGQVPSAIRAEPGDIISFDGNEGIHVGRLVQQRAIELYKPKRKKQEEDASDG
tara:strand:+ start:467 stop:691 length:225 start_codon:yes stop_codon:yes gene_type:complete